MIKYIRYLLWKLGIVKLPEGRVYCHICKTDTAKARYYNGECYRCRNKSIWDAVK